MYIHLDQFFSEASLPPLPYTPFDEGAYSRLSEKSSKAVFSALHKLIRGIPKGKGYKDIGVDVLRKYLNQPVKSKDQELVDKLANEFTSLLSKEMSEFWRTDKTKKEDIPDPLYDAQAALKDYEYALTHHQPSPDEARSMHSLKTLTVAPVHVPWSSSLKKMPGFVLSDFPGVQKNTSKMAPKNTPFDKKRFKEDWHGKVTLLPDVKSTPTSPPTLIFARERKSYRPVQMEHDPRPFFGLKKKRFNTLKELVKRNDPARLKAFLDKHNIPHEKVIVPSLYDRVIVQYYAGPWRDKKHTGKPFQVTVFIKGEQAYDNIFSTQKEAEKAVRVWVKNVAKSRGGMQGWMNFTYNKRRFPISPDKLSKILKVLNNGGKYRMPRTEGVYLVFRGKVPRVRNSWDVRKELENTHTVVLDLTRQLALMKNKMDKADGASKLELRSDFIRLRKEMKSAEERYERAQEGAKIDREVAERIAPMKLKAPLKANIMMIESRE